MNEQNLRRIMISETDMKVVGLFELEFENLVSLFLSNPSLWLEVMQQDVEKAQIVAREIFGRIPNT